MASGLVNTTQQVGAALGVAVLSTLAAARAGHLLAVGQPAAGALTGGYHLAFGTGAGLAAAALVLAAAALRPPRTGTARPTPPYRRGPRQRAPRQRAPRRAFHPEPARGLTHAQAKRPACNDHVLSGVAADPQQHVKAPWPPLGATRAARSG